MRKKVFVLNAIELMNQLMNGKRVEGVLYVDQNTGKLTFTGHRVAQRAQPGRKECAHREGTGLD